MNGVFLLVAVFLGDHEAGELQSKTMVYMPSMEICEYVAENNVFVTTHRDNSVFATCIQHFEEPSTPVPEVKSKKDWHSA